jgi:hypothetical protein
VVIIVRTVEHDRARLEHPFGAGARQVTLPEFV